MKGAVWNRFGLSPHWPFWLMIGLIAPLGLWAYRGAALEADFAMLMSFCSTIAR